MYSKYTRIKLFCIYAAALWATVSCHSAEAERMADLTEGYWAQENAPESPLINFSESGHLFFYLYTRSGSDGNYDACYDPEAQDYTKYAVDMANGRICLLPDLWYDIQVLNRNSLTLGSPAGSIKFTKIDPARVRMLSAEEYFLLHPEPRSH